MAWFKCFIEGENFPGKLVEQDGLVGFSPLGLWRPPLRMKPNSSRFKR
jgi:hypothetical protein